MQRALPSQRGTNGFLESPEASQGVGLAPPEPGDGSTSARKYLPQLEPTALEKEVLELREQLAEQDLRLKTERKEIEKREALVRYAAGGLCSSATYYTHVKTVAESVRAPFILPTSIVLPMDFSWTRLQNGLLSLECNVFTLREQGHEGKGRENKGTVGKCPEALRTIAERPRACWRLYCRHG